MEELKVSIIIPVYNVEQYISNCLRSVMRQTYQGAMECLIIDDCGKDESIAIAEGMIGEYNDNLNGGGGIRFRVLHHERNRGLSAARNTGTEAATGDYILYIDSDDAITNDCIEKLMAPILRDDTIEMVMGNFERFDTRGQLDSRHKKHDTEDLTSLEAVRCCYFDRNGIYVTAWNKLIKKDFIQSNGLTFREGLLYEDILWSFYVMKYLNHLYLIKDVTYLKSQRPDSITGSTNEKIKLYNYGLVFQELFQNFTPGDSHREAVFYTKGFCLFYIDGAQSETYRQAAKIIKNTLSFKDAPFRYMLLYTTEILSKFRIGRLLFYAGSGLYGIIRSI